MKTFYQTLSGVQIVFGAFTLPFGGTPELAGSFFLAAIALALLAISEQK